jgi:stearoyl-CoA desaturase (delta-9 desaturase)
MRSGWARKPLGEKALVLGFVLLPALGTALALALAPRGLFTWLDLAIAGALYAGTSLGVTVGFHRMLAHRAFEAHPAVEAALLALGTMAAEGPPTRWATDHALHHAHTDAPGDPHSPADGFLHAHLGWIFTHVTEPADRERFGAPLARDPVVRFFDRHVAALTLAGFLLPFLAGGLLGRFAAGGGAAWTWRSAWSALLLGGPVRVFALHQMTYAVNSVCHSFGRRAFATADRSRNNWVMGLLAMGEGWHNNHHAFPASARFGLRPWQLDLGGACIGALARLGFARNIRGVDSSFTRVTIARRSPCSSFRRSRISSPTSTAATPPGSTTSRG